MTTPLFDVAIFSPSPGGGFCGQLRDEPLSLEPFGRGEEEPAFPWCDLQLGRCVRLMPVYGKLDGEAAQVWTGSVRLGAFSFCTVTRPADLAGRLLLTAWRDKAAADAFEVDGAITASSEREILEVCRDIERNGDLHYLATVAAWMIRRCEILAEHAAARRWRTRASQVEQRMEACA